MGHLKHLSKDKKLKKILELQEPFVLAPRKKVYLHLCSSIISQQLSTKVAKVIFRRFLDLFGKKEPTAKEILQIPVEKFRSIGFSNAKASYVHNAVSYTH